MPHPRLDEPLGEAAGFVRRFVVMSEAQADITALWVAHTHAFAAADTTPYLAITSAEKRSGKTRLLEVLELLAARPWLTGRVTAAVLARKVDAEKPALLLDESDAAFKGAEEYVEALRGLLNTGHRLGGKVTVCVATGGEISYKDFSTFCPKCIAGIGKLPDTVADRAIPIRLERRAPDEQAERFRRRDAELDAFVLREHLELLAGFVERLEAARPELPDELNDRAQDAAEPLLAIADMAGEGWPTRARRALVELHGGRAIEDESVGVRLLADVRTVFADEERLASTDLLERLHQLEEAPWSEWYGKPLTTRGLAKMLMPYGIRPHSDGGSRGYDRDALADAWARYLPLNPSIRQDSALGAGSSPISTRQSEKKTDGSESAANPHADRDPDGLTLRTPKTPPGGGYGDLGRGSRARPADSQVRPHRGRRMSTDAMRIVVGLPRVALTRKEAAASLGVGLTFFEQSIQPELRVIRRGAKVLVPVAELERWAQDNAASTLGEA